MKNTLLVLLTSVITFSFFGSIKKTTIPINKITYIPTVDTFKQKLDSLENYKNKMVNEYAKKIEISYAVVKNEKKKQEELLLSADSIYSLSDSLDSIKSN